MALKVSDLPKSIDRPLIKEPPHRSRRIYSVAEWLKLPERPRTELFGGLVQKMPPPTQNHWRIIHNITASLDAYVLSNKLGTLGGEVSVLIEGLTGNDGWLPDLTFASKENPIKIGSSWDGLPDWVLEVWAGQRKETKRINDKRKCWQDAGVPELWEVILYKGQQTINVYRLDENGVYQLVSLESALICSAVIQGFCIERTAIFANLVES